MCSAPMFDFSEFTHLFLFCMTSVKSYRMQITLPTCFALWSCHYSPLPSPYLNKKCFKVSVWAPRSLRLRFSSSRFLFFFFFFFFWPAFVDFGRQISLVWTVNVLFTYCAVIVYILKNIKNRSHGTIYTFKNYFATVFSVFSFQFSVSATISSIQTDP